MKSLDGILFEKMVSSGAASLRSHVKEINDLNVFPIPDGDTGDNMLMTMMGGVSVGKSECESLSDAASRVSDGMLLSARGNSGVILSQFFEGIKNGFTELCRADASELGEAFRRGVEQAYSAVITPTEGTILTVVREATEYACGTNAESTEDFLKAFLDEAKRSLERTPELLPVLKKAGVVDSGAAALVYIIDGMLKAVLGEELTLMPEERKSREEIDLNAFGEDSILEFGYCTELLLRLQRVKTDIATFDVSVISDYLSTVGDSIVAVKNGSIVKLHVHTMTPQKVLDYCQKYGEFLKVKIENMSLQHNSITEGGADEKPKRERTEFGVVAVASGEGLKEAFIERGADVIVDGGQSMNPSTEAFIEAFDTANADVIFVFPNNKNIILTAEQAAHLYKGSEVHVIESTTIGDGYASLSMLDTSSGDKELILEELKEAMDGVITAEISHCVRDATFDGDEVHTGDYIGFVGKEILSHGASRLDTAIATVDKLALSSHDICIIISGKDASSDETKALESYVKEHYPRNELYLINGGQDVYDYIIIVE